MVAVETGIAPDSLWRQDPKDLATLVDVLTERAEAMNRRR